MLYELAQNLYLHQQWDVENWRHRSAFKVYVKRVCVARLILWKLRAAVVGVESVGDEGLTNGHKSYNNKITHMLHCAARVLPDTCYVCTSSHRNKANWCAALIALAAHPINVFTFQSNVCSQIEMLTYSRNYINLSINNLSSYLKWGIKAVDD